MSRASNAATPAALSTRSFACCSTAPLATPWWCCSAAAGAAAVQGHSAWQKKQQGRREAGGAASPAPPAGRPPAPPAGEDGYESATSELHFPDGITSPSGSGHFDVRCAAAPAPLRWLVFTGAALRRSSAAALHAVRRLPPDPALASTPSAHLPACCPQLTELDLIEPDSPTVGCIGKRPQRLYVCTSRPRAGSSVRQHRGPDDGTACCAIEAADGRTFMVRSLDYMRTKVKEPSGQQVYR